MIPIPANIKTVLALVLVGAVGALNALGKLEPSWSWVGAVVSLLVVLETAFTIPQSAQDRLDRSELGKTVKP
jgi:hypothetical protein